MVLSPSRQDFRPLLLLYALSCFTYYLATWYAYGGLGAGHPPLLNVEEFVASAGVKFSVYFLMSCCLFRLMDRFTSARTATQFLWRQAGMLFLFVLSAHQLQSLVLNAFGWVHFFGGRLAIFNHLVAAAFYFLQIAFLLTLRKFRPGDHPEQTSPRPALHTASILARKGTHEVPIEWYRVDYLSGFGNYTKAWVAGEAYLLSFGIGSAGDKVPAEEFLRIHRSYLINLKQLEKIVRDGRRYQAVMADGTRLPIGATYLATLRAWRL